MSGSVVGRVLANSKQKGSARLVLVSIADNASEGGIAFPGTPLIAQKAAISERQTVRVLDKLATSGELYIEKPEKAGRGAKTFYALLSGFTEPEIIQCLITGLNKSQPDAEAIAKRMTDLQKGDKSKRVTFSTEKGDIFDRRVTKSIEKGDTVELKTPITMEPSLETKEPSDSGAPVSPPPPLALPVIEKPAEPKTPETVPTSKQGVLLDVKDVPARPAAKADKLPKESKPEWPKQTPELKDALATLCRQSWTIKSGASWLSKSLRELLMLEPTLTAERLIEFGRWWYKNDWRGQKNQAPSPAQVATSWLAFTQAKGQSDGHISSTNTAPVGGNNRSDYAAGRVKLKEDSELPDFQFGVPRIRTAV